MSLAPLNDRTAPPATWVDAEGRTYAPWSVAETQDGVHSGDASIHSGKLLFHTRTPRKVRDAGAVLAPNDVVYLRLLRENYDARRAAIDEAIKLKVYARAAEEARARGWTAAVQAAAAASVYAKARAAFLPAVTIRTLRFRVAFHLEVRTRAEERDVFGPPSDGGPVVGMASTRPPSKTMASANVGVAAMQLEDANWGDVAFVLGGAADVLELGALARFGLDAAAATAAAAAAAAVAAKRPRPRKPRRGGGGDGDGGGGGGGD